MTKFIAEVTVGKRDREVVLRIPAGSRIAPGLRGVSVAFDGAVSHHRREPDSSTVLEYHPMPGSHRLEIDFGGPMPAAMRRKVSSQGRPSSPSDGREAAAHMPSRGVGS